MRLLDSVLRPARRPFAALLLFGTAGIVAMIVVLTAAGGGSPGHRAQPITPTAPSAPSLPAPPSDLGTPASDIGGTPPLPSDVGASPAVTPSPPTAHEHRHGHHEEDGPDHG